MFGADPLGRFAEVESGRRRDRPEREKELTFSKLTGARLLVAWLDRQEREAISRRTTDALAAAKARGLRLGTPQPNHCTQARRKGRRSARDDGRRQRRLLRPGPGCSSQTRWPPATPSVVFLQPSSTPAASSPVAADDGAS